MAVSTTSKRVDVKMIGNAIFGGLLIGLAASVLFVGLGRISGVSGILGVLSSGLAKRLFHSGMARFELLWRSSFALGLLCGGVLLLLFKVPAWLPSENTSPIFLITVAGLIVGVGSRMGSGCTSGHGVCGLARFSGRSLLATATFIAAGIATASLMNVMVK